MPTTVHSTIKTFTPLNPWRMVHHTAIPGTSRRAYPHIEVYQSEEEFALSQIP